MAIRINNDIVIGNDKKFYGDGSNLTNITKNLIVGVRVGVVTVTASSGIITVFGRSSNTNVTTV